MKPNPRAARTKPEADPPTPGQVRAAWRKVNKALDEPKFVQDDGRKEGERIAMVARAVTPDDPFVASAVPGDQPVPGVRPGGFRREDWRWRRSRTVRRARRRPGRGGWRRIRRSANRV